MADKNAYSTIKQHEPLRIPDGWNAKEKRLIAQLEEILDDIYSRFGRLKMADMSKPLQEDIKKAANASFEIKHLEDGLELKADKAIKDPVTGEETTLSSLLAATAAGLSQKADSTIKLTDGSTTTLSALLTATAEGLSQKADSKIIAPDGTETTLSALIKATAEGLSQKADKNLVLPDGSQTTLSAYLLATAEALKYTATSDSVTALGKLVEKNTTDIETTSKGVTALVEGTTPAGAVSTTKAKVTKEGFWLQTDGTFVVESGNFKLDENGNMVANDATINGDLLNKGQPVLTPLDIYVGTSEPPVKKAGMIWIRPKAESETPDAAQTTHSWEYNRGSRLGLASNPIDALLSGGGAPSAGSNITYELTVPIYFGGTVSNASLTAVLSNSAGSVTLSASGISGKLYDRRNITLGATSSVWLAQWNEIAIHLSASSDNILNDKSGSGYVIRLVSRSTSS